MTQNRGNSIPMYSNDDFQTKVKMQSNQWLVVCNHWDLESFGPARRSGPRLLPTNRPLRDLKILGVYKVHQFKSNF